MELISLNERELTLVIWRVLDNLGKSLTPESKMLMDDSRSCREDRREDTEDERDSAIVGIGIASCGGHYTILDLNTFDILQQALRVFTAFIGWYIS
jgi:hypothetical protein